MGEGGDRENKRHRSVIPFPCYLNVVKIQRPQSRTKFCRKGQNSICSYLHAKASLEGLRPSPRDLRASKNGLKANLRSPNANLSGRRVRQRGLSTWHRSLRVTKRGPGGSWSGQGKGSASKPEDQKNESEDQLVRCGAEINNSLLPTIKFHFSMIQLKTIWCDSILSIFDFFTHSFSSSW